MNDYLILFENMLGVVAMRKHLTAAGQPFTVTDIPPSLGKACGLGIRLYVSDDSLPALRERPQVTEIYRCETEEYVLTVAE
ncbi:putative Se/S carrier-like protein [Morganella morganii]|uniref:putative Se/S carrier-like protein n=1 Tax=Morganella morganii TaxID=582 RepID=UPI002367E29A|nr:putative Se/S carrier-like protein [Morganella morganii]